jgi:branched-chain amino acid transport system substrate-binding protein
MVGIAACSSGGSTASTAATTNPVSVHATKSTLLLGVDGDWSGITSEDAQPELAGIKAWASWTNANGGINGHPVQLIVEDDQGNPATGLANVEDLVQNKHVIALVGVYANTTEPTWASYVESKNIPVVGGEEDTDVWLTNPDFFPSAEPGLGVIATEAYIAKLAGGGLATINLAGVQDVGPLIQAFQAATAKDGVAYRFHTTVSAASPSYTAACLAAQQSGAKVLALQLDTNTATRVSTDCFSQGYKPSYLVPSEVYASSMLGQSQFNDAYVPSPTFLWFGGTPVAMQFRTAMAKYQPSAPLNPNSTEGWTAGLLFGAAAEHIGADPTSQDILNGLYALPANDTLGGASPGATFSRGKPALPSGCFFLAQIQGSDLTAPRGDAPVCPST